MMQRPPTSAGLGQAAGATIGGYVAVALVLGDRLRLPRLCPFYRLTGRGCPLCGLTRGLGLVGRGRLREAVAQYPAALATAIVVSLLALTRIRRG